MSSYSDFDTRIRALSIPDTAAPTGVVDFTTLDSLFKAQKIDTPVWEAELYSENQSLNPTQETPESDGSTSYGWWQFKTPGGLGDGHTTQELEDPYLSSKLAARDMGALVANAGATSQYDQLKAISGDWPGSWGPTKNSPGGIARVPALVAFGGAGPSQVNNQPGDTSTTSSSTDTGTTALSPFQTILRDFFLGSLAIALIVAGINWMSNGAIVNAVKSTTKTAAEVGAKAAVA